MTHTEILLNSLATFWAFWLLVGMVKLTEDENLCEKHLVHFGNISVTALIIWRIWA